MERATACIALIHVLNAEALAFDGGSNEEVRTRILILDRCQMCEIMETKLNLKLLHSPLQSIDVTVQKALECPCLDDLKRGPCGSQFIDAFSCYLKSTKEEKVDLVNFRNLSDLHRVNRR